MKRKPSQSSSATAPWRPLPLAWKMPAILSTVLRLHGSLAEHLVWSSTQSPLRGQGNKQSEGRRQQFHLHEATEAAAWPAEVGRLLRGTWHSGHCYKPISGRKKPEGKGTGHGRVEGGWPLFPRDPGDVRFCRHHGGRPSSAFGWAANLPLLPYLLPGPTPPAQLGTQERKLGDGSRGTPGNDPQL